MKRNLEDRVITTESFPICRREYRRDIGQLRL